MEYIIISIILVITLIILAFVFDVTPKTLKEISWLTFNNCKDFTVSDLPKGCVLKERP